MRYTKSNRAGHDDNQRRPTHRHKGEEDRRRGADCIRRSHLFHELFEGLIDQGLIQEEICGTKGGTSAVQQHDGTDKRNRRYCTAAKNEHDEGVLWHALAAF
jgi:hypothetical protein